MSSRRFSDPIRRALTLLAVALLSGCASGPRPPAGPATGEAGGPEGGLQVPPEVLTMYEQAVAVMAAGDATDAELRLQAFVLQYPGYPGAHVNLAILFAGRDDFLAAEASLNEALAIDAGHAAALNQLGVVYRRQGRFFEAESAYMKAVTASPDYALAHYNLAVLYDLYLQRLGDALGHYERYQQLAGEDEQVTKWIADLKRRIDVAQRTANVTE